MTDEERQEWDEANEMERRYPNDPLVIMTAIQVRQRILRILEAKRST